MLDSKLLADGLNQLDLSLPVKAQENLLSYLQLLLKWNQSYNLTSITQMEEMITHHLLDSLSIAPFIQGGRILDVGTGAGFPGIPLAVCFPDYEWVLLDSNSKKLRFITQALSELKLLNVRLVHNRVESFDEAQGFSDIMARAVTSLADFTRLSQHLLAPKGQWLAMKGLYPEEELKAIHYPYQVKKLHVPGLSAERHLVVIKKSDAS